MLNAMSDFTIVLYNPPPARNDGRGPVYVQEQGTRYVTCNVDVLLSNVPQSVTLFLRKRPEVNTQRWDFCQRNNNIKPIHEVTNLTNEQAIITITNYERIDITVGQHFPNILLRIKISANMRNQGATNGQFDFMATPDLTNICWTQAFRCGNQAIPPAIVQKLDIYPSRGTEGMFPAIRIGYNGAIDPLQVITNWSVSVGGVGARVASSLAGEAVGVLEVLFRTPPSNIFEVPLPVQVTNAVVQVGGADLFFTYAQSNDQFIQPSTTIHQGHSQFNPDNIIYIQPYQVQFQRIQQYQPFADFTNNLYNELSQIDEDQIPEEFERIFKEQVKKFADKCDFLGRNLAFYFATLPDCPPTLVRFLFEAYDFDLEVKDIFGYTVADWATELGVPLDIIDFVTPESTDSTTDTTTDTCTTPDSSRKSQEQFPSVPPSRGTTSGSEGSINKLLQSISVKTPQEKKVANKLAKLLLEPKALITQTTELRVAAIVAEKITSDNVIDEKGLALIESSKKDDRPNSLKIKLVLIEPGDAASAAVFKTATNKPQYGNIRTAVSVGSKFIEWTDQSIVAIRDCKDSRAIFAIDICEVAEGDQKSVVKKISDRIVEYNVNKKYSYSMCNCQHFVDDLLLNLNMKPNFTGLIGEYIERVRITGELKPELHLTDKMLKDLKVVLDEQRIITRSIMFNTHLELDGFVIAIKTKLPLFFSKENEELNTLLKAFDRGFWLKHLHDAKDDRFVPCKHPTSNVLQCPFGDPKKGTWWEPTDRKANVSFEGSTQQPAQTSCSIQ